MTVIPIMIGALGIISKNTKSWYGRLSLSDIFGSIQFSVIHVTAHILGKVLCLLAETRLRIPRKYQRTGGDYTIIKVKVNLKKRGWSRIKEMNMGYIKVKGDYLFYFVRCEHRNASHS